MAQVFANMVTGTSRNEFLIYFACKSIPYTLLHIVFVGKYYFLTKTMIKFEKTELMSFSEKNLQVKKIDPKCKIL